MKLHFNYDKKTHIAWSAAFFLVTIIGCLSHELGHYVVAKSLGYEAEVHYAFVSHSKPAVDSFLNASAEKYWPELTAGKMFPGKDRYDAIATARYRDDFLIRLGGPAQTHLVSIIALILLFVCKQHHYLEEPSRFRFWLVCAAVFVLRQPVNLLMSVLALLITGRFPDQSDEVFIARFLQVPDWFFVVLTGIIGVVIYFLTVTNFVAARNRILFHTSCITGGVFGYIFWLYGAGPVLLP